MSWDMHNIFDGKGNMFGLPKNRDTYRLFLSIRTGLSFLWTLRLLGMEPFGLARQ
jgi:hypothetical protein